jgi:hypothetical protein
MDIWEVYPFNDMTLGMATELDIPRFPTDEPGNVVTHEG